MLAVARSGCQALASGQSPSQWDIELRFTPPGKPDHNAYFVRFNCTYREAVNCTYLFDSLDEIREITAE